jgi:hypothetical protein
MPFYNTYFKVVKIFYFKNVFTKFSENFLRLLTENRLLGKHLEDSGAIICADFFDQLSDYQLFK